MREETDPVAMLGQAEQAQVRIRRAGRWYPALLAGYGLFTIGIVSWLPAVRGNWSGIAFSLVAVAAVAAMSWWKSRHAVRPTSRRAALRWAVPWTVLYVAAVTWFGPTYLDHVVGWWALMGVVVAIPVFAEAGRVWLRVRR
ncbi:hypothetical protein [Kutzneria sp. CA-103260]|uniref:hypothetical protein n=1 Tax=Kutzneria sp. CA-103260 TaxID=2802641 RepID=UPI001BABCAC8|nr:hypothetical protein [Kutzneria sp. CA-103260]QUQ67651.1 hypothetical protein JJ691_53860 [Kutzneria sp. CA-103260]